MPHNLFPNPLLPRLFTKIGLFPGDNIQVTSGTPKQARSESIIAANPRDRNNLIAASKKFSNPETYRFTIGVRVSFDGGESWQDATLPTLPEWGDMVGIGSNDASAGMTDPAVAFDDFGNAFMVGEPSRYFWLDKTSKRLVCLSISQPMEVCTGVRLSLCTSVTWDDDKSWIACDNNPASPHYGNIYIAWGASSPLRFARSTDHGQSWKGVGSQAPGSQLANSTYAPEISVGLDGTVHIVWYNQQRQHHHRIYALDRWGRNIRGTEADCGRRSRSQWKLDRKSVEAATCGRISRAPRSVSLRLQLAAPSDRSSVQ